MTEKRRFEVIKGGKDGKANEPVVTAEEWESRKRSAERAVKASVERIGADDLYTDKRAVRHAMTYASYSLDLLTCERELARRARRPALTMVEARLLAMLEATIPQVSEKGQYGGLHAYLTGQAQFFKNEYERRMHAGEEAAQTYYEAYKNLDTLNRVLPRSGDPVPKPLEPWKNFQYQDPSNT